MLCALEYIHSKCTAQIPIKRCCRHHSRSHPFNSPSNSILWTNKQTNKNSTRTIEKWLSLWFTDSCSAYTDTHLRFLLKSTEINEVPTCQLCVTNDGALRLFSVRERMCINLHNTFLAATEQFSQGPFRFLSLCVCSVYMRKCDKNWTKTRSAEVELAFILDGI